jgi:hypothetical protein
MTVREPTGPGMTAPAPATRRRGRLSTSLRVGLVVGLLAAAGLTWQTSYAAFRDQTSSTGNVVTAGTVSLTNERAGQQILPSIVLVPGRNLTTCVRVTYSGTVRAEVRLYADSYTDHGLGPFLTVTVEEGTGGSHADCSGFTPTRSVAVAEPLNTFGARTGWADGLAGDWTPTGSDTITYRIRLDFPSTANDDDAQATSVDLAIGWAAEST